MLIKKSMEIVNQHRIHIILKEHFVLFLFVLFIFLIFVHHIIGGKNMELNFNEVPNDILTSKDLDYLSDMFEWNYIAFKKTNTACSIVSDEEIIAVLEKGCGLFDNNLNSVLNILESRGTGNE